MDMPITVETAQKVLQDMGNSKKHVKLHLEGIIKVVTEHYNIKQEELFNKKRTLQNIAFHVKLLCISAVNWPTLLSYPCI